MKTNFEMKLDNYLLEEHHDKAVDLDSNDRCQQSQGDVGCDSDQGEIRDGHKSTEDTTKHSSRGCRCVPQHQLFTGLLQY